MKNIGYIRVSTDKEELNKQRHLLIIINEFIEIEISSSKSSRVRKIDELTEKLEKVICF